MAAMVALVIAAFFVPGAGNAANFITPSAIIHPSGLALWAALAAALQGAFWAYDGWAKITFIAGEVKDPQRNIPRALFLGMMIVTGLYLLMNAAYAYVQPIDAMAQSKLVAADLADRCFSGGGRWIAVAVMISTAGCANAMILASARVHFAMAERGVFPRCLAVVHHRHHTPGASLWVQGAWSTMLLFSGTFDMLTDTLVFVSWIFYAASAYGVFVLRRKEPDTPRPYKVPGYPVVPWVVVGFALLFLAFTIYNDVATYRAAVSAGRPALINSAFGLFLLLLGTPIYIFYERKRRSSAHRLNAEP
jgi:APA family basic amino acid/polyamine antiporter